MPLYGYINEATGETLELRAPVRRRDAVAPAGFRRVTVPERLNVMFSDAPPSQESQAMRGLHELEQTMDVNRMEAEIGFTRNQLRRIWESPD